MSSFPRAPKTAEKTRKTTAKAAAMIPVIFKVFNMLIYVYWSYSFDIGQSVLFPTKFSYDDIVEKVQNFLV